MYYDKFNFEFKFSKRRQIKKIKISNLYIRHLLCEHFYCVLNNQLNIDLKKCII